MYGLDDVFNILIYLLYISIINFIMFYSSYLCDCNPLNFIGNSEILTEIFLFTMPAKQITSAIKTYHFWKVAVPMDLPEGYGYLKGTIVHTCTCTLLNPSHKPVGVCVPMSFTSCHVTTMPQPCHQHHQD